MLPKIFAQNKWIILSSFCLFGLLVITFSHSTVSAASTIYVKADATGSNDGTSWDNAFVDLQDALAQASFGDEIWVAQGRYLPGQSSADSFRLVHGVSLKGGYSGNINDPAERDWQTYLTVLSGDVDGNDIVGDFGVTSEMQGDNAENIVRGEGVSSNTLLEGFTITGGGALPGEPEVTGGGMYITNSSATLRDLVFTGNQAKFGGGLYNRNSTVAIESVIFIENHAFDRGGGMYNNGSVTTLNDVTFASNTSDILGSGTFNNPQSSLIVTNSKFVNHISLTNSAAAINNKGVLDIANSEFFTNESSSTGAVSSSDGTIKITNSIFKNNKGNFGGALQVHNSNSVNLENIIFENNTSGNIGGALLLSLSNTESVEGLTFLNNQAAEGGGMYVSKTTAALKQMDFRGNTAENGGGVFVQEGDVHLDSSIISGNVATNNGGGVYIEDSSANFINLTVTGNRADNLGGGFYHSQALPDYYNNIIWNNMDRTGIGTESASINSQNENGAPAWLQNNLIQSLNAIPNRGNGGGLDIDPQFIVPINPTNAPTVEGSARLQTSSPAIDTGQIFVTLPPVDLDADGRSRVQGASINLGAFETSYDVSLNGCGELRNGNFENTYQGNWPDYWLQQARAEIALGRTGNGLAIMDNFASQSIPATGDAQFILSGYYKLEGHNSQASAGSTSWSGIGADYVKDGEEIGETLAHFTADTDGFVYFEIEGALPSTANGINIWLFSNFGAVLTVDDLELTWTTCDPDIDPPPPAEACGPLLNGGFEDGFNHWTEQGAWEIVPGRSGNGIAISQEYINQMIAAGKNSDFILSGYYKLEGHNSQAANGSTSWSGVGVDYLQDGTKVGEALAHFTADTDGFVYFEINGTTTPDTDEISLWIFSNFGAVLTVDDLELTWTNCDTDPPPPPPACGPLLNGGFEDGFNHWEEHGAWEIVPGRTGNGIQVTQNYVSQSFPAVENASFKLSGYFTVEGFNDDPTIGNTTWVGIGTDHLQDGVELKETVKRINGDTNGYTYFEYIGYTTESGTDEIELWIFSNFGAVLTVDDLELTWANCD